MDSEDLRDWFTREKRNLLWREETTPYRVLISEVMLQQTQASVVTPYYQRWMERFPDFEALAAAPFEEVVKLWEGLGYYSRARSLWNLAKIVIEEHSGALPSTKEELLKLKGIGDYTSSALLAFAFHQRAAAIDGNVKRFLSRYFLIQEPIDSKEGEKKIAEAAEGLLPQKRPWEISEAFIEFGATLCKKKPECHRCPFQKSCEAYREGLEATLPNKKPRPKTIELFRYTLLLEADEHLLVRPPGGKRVMKELHEFPMLEKKNVKRLSELPKHVEKEFQLEATPLLELEPLQHGFTRYKATLYPVHCRVSERAKVKDHIWVKREELTERAFSSGHKRALERYLALEATYT